MKKKIKICYIGGGSKLWARIFMNDLALSSYIEGEIALYDIDIAAAKRNEAIGNRISNHKEAKSFWLYKVYENIDDALRNSDVVLISILPGTFKEMYSDVHAPEEYGVYQSVGDTTGPGGILRAMRTVPIYEFFAKKIEEICPSSWVINLTNPMSICVKTLYDVFPNIKAFGCCHEVFHAQDLLKDVAKEILHIDELSRKDISFDVSGINHFTWISDARYRDINLLELLDEFYKNHPQGHFERGPDDDYLTNPFSYNNMLKYNLYKRYNVLPAAGDRHLAEFFPNTWFLKSKEDALANGFNLTPVDLRIAQQKEKVQNSIDLANGNLEVSIEKSSEEAVELIESVLGLRKTISNVNLPNKGQVPYLENGIIVESNCVFIKDKVKPIKANDLPSDVKSLIIRNALNIETCYEGIKNRDFKKIFNSFVNQSLCSSLSIEDARELFKKMVLNTNEYLKDYYDLNKIINDEF